MLYLVPTPVGNLDDMTFRAVKTLKEVDIILAEDTRVTGKLLKHYSIDTKMRAYHAHNEHKVLDSIVEELDSGVNIAIVTDAGTPGISDPGFLLVRACHEKGISVSCLPGATAIIPAIVSSGLPCEKFVFEGFLPQKKGRQTRFIALAEEERTIVLYESPHRLVKSLKQMLEFWGDRQACVSREISKIYEEHRSGMLSELITHYEGQAVKGEIVISVEGKKA